MKDSVERTSMDWLMSLLVPGMCQFVYRAPASGAVFVLCAVATWGWYGVPRALLIHALAAYHAATLVYDHFTGARPVGNDLRKRELWTRRPRDA